MSERIRHRIRNNVYGFIAIFIMLGGVAVAANKAAPRNSVATKSIRDGAVTAPKLGCKGNDPADVMVKVGPTCVDRYEASVWSSPTGGTQYGVSTDDYPCDDNGQDCKDEIFARSVAGVTPSRQITWFQAQQALANSGKRMITNAEWQMAVAGTPDSTDCNVGPAGSVANTGANGSCVSRHGANDMVGNLWEWVADWDEEAMGCANWPAGFGGDLSCLGRGSGEASSRFPGALIRGGSFANGTAGGPFAVVADSRPSAAGITGLRGAR